MTRIRPCFQVFLLLTCFVEVTPVYGDEDNIIKPLFEELFLSEVVYPQERGELQVTTGFFWNRLRDRDSRLPVLLEYGVTDSLQIEVLFPTEFERTGPVNATGMGNIELGLFCNFFNDASWGRAYGVGVELGLPSATTDVCEQALSYEPFFVAYQEFEPFAVNFFAALEIEDPIRGAGDTGVAGEIGVAAFRSFGPFVPIIELGIEIEEDETEVRSAPAVYWKPQVANWELGVSMPIGLTEETPSFGVFVLFNVEFEGSNEDGMR